LIDRGVNLKNLSERSWQIVSDEMNLLNSKIETKGTSLVNWNGISFNRGITTGLNEVFIIDKNKGNNEWELHKEDLVYDVIHPSQRNYK
jgi:hypothetical protein